MACETAVEGRGVLDRHRRVRRRLRHARLRQAPAEPQTPAPHSRAGAGLRRRRRTANWPSARSSRTAPPGSTKPTSITTPNGCCSASARRAPKRACGWPAARGALPTSNCRPTPAARSICCVWRWRCPRRNAKAPPTNWPQITTRLSSHLFHWPHRLSRRASLARRSRNPDGNRAQSGAARRDVDQVARGGRADGAAITRAWSRSPTKARAIWASPMSGRCGSRTTTCPPPTWKPRCERLWGQMQPFYEQLHCYVRGAAQPALRRRDRAARPADPRRPARQHVGAGLADADAARAPARRSAPPMTPPSS